MVQRATMKVQQGSSVQSMLRFMLTVLGCCAGMSTAAGSDVQRVEADLLIVGGTESGCAAAVQAARMGVRRIVLVNDIDWLGGQFSAEGLGAIDENRAHGYDGSVPIPRSGLFREVLEAIEDRNAELYGGVRRPGNTRVITTVRPAVARRVFEKLLEPLEATGTLTRYSRYQIHSARVTNNRLASVEFHHTENPERRLVVSAKMTIDASDWGDVIRACGAEYDFGIDARSEFSEPRAPETAEPRTDLNPITWSMILLRQEKESLIPRPDGYDERSFAGKWGWIDEEFAYTTRRLVDGQGFAKIDHPDVLLINNPNVDYPVDVYPASVVRRLEATAPGASTLNIVEMTPTQRAIVFADARGRSLQYLFYLQSRFPKFRRMALSTEFGTPDRLPPKPYIREGLRLVARHIVKEQEVLGVGARSNYAAAMFPDAVFSWQFELDFHPTARRWLSEDGAEGPWEAGFRGLRRFGAGGTGRAVFPLRSLVPKQIDGLLGAQKNLGYTSIVSSSCRLHDQSMAAGQAAGAVAAVSVSAQVRPADFCFRPSLLARVWDGLLSPHEGVPVVVWPFADVEPREPGFAAIQHLALRRLLPLTAADVEFLADEPATPEWRDAVLQRVIDRGYRRPTAVAQELETRRDFAISLWAKLRQQPEPGLRRAQADDADGDGIPDSADPLPFTSGRVSWTLPPGHDGLPDGLTKRTEAWDFASVRTPPVQGFRRDAGGLYQQQAGFGWLENLTENTRHRRDAHAVRAGFVFTRRQDTWERRLANGRYRVTVCIGDSEFDQPGQNVSVEGHVLARDAHTSAAEFSELSAEVAVADGRLTVTIGRERGGANTTLNWLLIEPVTD